MEATPRFSLAGSVAVGVDKIQLAMKVGVKKHTVPLASNLSDPQELGEDSSRPQKHSMVYWHLVLATNHVL